MSILIALTGFVIGYVACYLVMTYNVRQDNE